jgi:Plasmid encoded RepA protein
VSTNHTETAADLMGALQRYEAAGYSRARILARLVADGYPVDALRPLFAQFPDSAFVRAELPGPRAPTLRGLPSGWTPPAPVAEAPRTETPTVTPTPPVNGSTALEGISFHYVPLIQCSFPHADPRELTSFTRRNGWLELTLGTTRPETGLPYGVPARLLTIYCASEAVRTRSPEIYLGKSVHEFLRLLDVPVTRGERGNLRVYANQLLRLIHCTLSIDENIRDASGRTGLHIRQALFADEARLWWDEDATVGQGSTLQLSAVLFQSILERSAPLATSAIKALRKSPMDLDVYAWLVHRLFHLSKPSTVTWQQLSDQFGHAYAELRQFRRFFLDSLARVRAVYPEANVNLVDGGVMLLPSRPHLARRAKPR